MKKLYCHSVMMFFFTSARLSFLLRVTIFSRRGRWNEASKTDVMKENALPVSHNLVEPTKKVVLSWFA